MTNSQILIKRSCNSNIFFQNPMKIDGFPQSTCLEVNIPSGKFTYFDNNCISHTCFNLQKTTKKQQKLLVLLKKWAILVNFSLFLLLKH